MERLDLKLKLCMLNILIMPMTLTKADIFCHGGWMARPDAQIAWEATSTAEALLGSEIWLSKCQRLRFGGKGEALVVMVRCNKSQSQSCCTLISFVIVAFELEY